MTAHKKRMGEGLARGDLLFCLAGAAALFATFIFSDAAVGAMSEGMSLCVRTVIPSLFPFMVVSELLVRGGAAEHIGRYLGRPLSHLFGLSPDGAAALVLGLICGFPIGSRCALSLYERKRICKGELEHLLTFCNNPSSAFLIGAVGVGLFSSKGFGLLLYFTHMLSSLTVGLIGQRYFALSKAEGRYFSGKMHADSKGGALSNFCSAVSDSARSMLSICAFVIFFSAVSGVLGHLASLCNMPQAMSTVLQGILEMTGGVNAASALPYSVAPIAAAAVTGWSGLSVAFQLGGLCGEHRLSLKPYFLSKAFCAVFNSAAVMLALTLLGGISSLGGSESVSLLLPTSSLLTPLWLSLFVGGCVSIRPKK